MYPPCRFQTTPVGLDPELDGARFPPKVWPEQSDIDATMKRWGEFGRKK